MNETIETAETELYFFNKEDNSCIGIWDSATEPGWYWSRYKIADDGVWREVDGGLWTVEYDDDGNIVEGYKTVAEAYADVALDGDLPCEESLFEAVREVADSQFSWLRSKQQAENKLKEVVEAQEEFLAEYHEFLAVA